MAKEELLRITTVVRERSGPFFNKPSASPPSPASSPGNASTAPIDHERLSHYRENESANTSDAESLQKMDTDPPSDQGELTTVRGPLSGNGLVNRLQVSALCSSGGSNKRGRGRKAVGAVETLPDAGSMGVGPAQDAYVEVLKYRGEGALARELEAWIPPRFPVTGVNLEEDFGWPPGREMGDCLTALRAEWAEGGCIRGKEEMLLAAKETFESLDPSALKAMAKKMRKIKKKKGQGGTGDSGGV